MNLSGWGLGWLGAILTGTLFAMQPGINAQLARHLHSPIQAAAVSFVVGTAALLLLCLLMPQPMPAASSWRAIPAWQWLGGLLGAVAVAMSLWLAHRLGAAGLTLAMLTGQIIMALVLDHMGWLGFEQKSISPSRIGGVVLVISGLWLVARA